MRKRKKHRAQRNFSKKSEIKIRIIEKLLQIIRSDSLRKRTFIFPKTIIILVKKKKQQQQQQRNENHAERKKSDAAKIV